MSGDSDGEVSENVIASPQKSFSVGLTIVSGFDSALRRSVIERIVSSADTGRIVVVTTGGITSTDETDGLTSSSSTSTSITSQPSSTIESPSDPSTAAAATSPSSTSPQTTSPTSNSTSTSANLSSSTSSASAPIPAATQANGTPQPQSPNAHRNNSQNLNSSNNTAIKSSQQLNENPSQTPPKSDRPSEPLSADKATPQSLPTVQNLEGWISCNNSEEMVEVVLKLAASREYDYIIAESAIDANMEPQHFAQTLHHRGGTSLRVDTLVSVLDGETLLGDLLASPLSTSPPPTPPSTNTTGLDSSDANGTSAGSGDTSEDPIPSGSARSPDGVTDESQALSSSSSSSTPSPIHDESSQQRPMILVSLVENANVVVVAQQPDDRSLEQLSRVQEIVSVLNGNASIVPTIMTANSSSSSTSTDENTLAVDLLINTNLYNNEDVEYSATWKRVLRAARIGPPIGTASLTGNKITGVGVGGVVGAPNGSSNSSTPRMSLPRYVKEATFLYKAKRPFHPSRLYEHIKDVATFTGVIRSTGRIWLATRMLAPLEWNQAGVAATLRTGKPFWAATPETEWPKSEEERDRILIDWDTRYGDRETEIVFVGIGIDKSRLQGLLDGCLLQDEEMVFNNLWENFEDPFVEWVPLIEDDDEEEAPMDLPTATVEPAPTPAVQVQEKEQVSPVETVEQEEQKEEEKGEVNRVGDDDAVADETLVPFDRDDLQQDEQGTDNRQLVDNDAVFEQVETIEGQIDDSELPNDVFDSVSVLELFGEGLSMKEGNDLDDGTDRRNAGTPTPLIAEKEDDGAYEDDDVMIASWDGAIADGILMKIPRIGVPITLLTGFLGSGKTTVLNHILSADHGLRIAVLVNEFGEIDIDSKLVEKNNKNGSFTWDAGDIMELTNGCICCDINESFLSAVERILDQRRDALDYIIVETTGVADPVPVINSLMETDIASEVRLDGVLTLVDALNFDVVTHMDSEAALSQIMAADTILLSKTDVADKAKVEEVVDFIRRYRPAARILRSQRGRVPLDLILDVGLRIADSPAHVDPSKSSTSTATNDTDHDHHQENDHDHDHDHNSESSCTHDHHGHDHDHKSESGCSQDHDHNHNHNQSHSHNHLETDGFMTTSFKSDRPLDAQLFMDRFLRLLPEGVYRAKGLLYFHGSSERYVFQLSGRRYHMQMDDWPEGDAPGNQLVVIGKDLNLKELRDTLENCHADTLVDDKTAAPDIDAGVGAAYPLSDDNDGADAENDG